MRIYCDSSALIKRSVAEKESDAVEATIGKHVAAGDVVVTSSLAWIEVSRALRRRTADGANEGSIQDFIDAALSGVAEHLITAEVVGLARRLGPTPLRTLDAIHLATAVLLDADLVVAYDDRPLEACRHNGLAAATPGR